MDELVSNILDFFKKTNKRLSYNELRKIFHIKGETQTNIFDCALKTLVENGSLFFNAREEYDLFENHSTLMCGELQRRKNGDTYVKVNGKHIAIDPSDLNGALEGDTVVIHNVFEEHKQLRGKVYKILKRKNNRLIFEVVGDGLAASLIPPIGFNTHIEVELSSKDRKKLHNGDHIVVTVGTESNDGVFNGELEEIINKSGELKLTNLLVAHKLGIEVEFSEAALEEAKKIPTEVSEEEIVGRVDLRDKMFFTIDCDNTKDRDDAICVEKLPNGNYKLYTAISHVTYYVKPGSVLFNEAISRGSSYYPDGDCIPMLPKELSNGICSLNENVDRLVRVTEMEIDKNGNVVDHDIYQSVIRSRKEMKYSDVNKVLDRYYVSHLNEFKDNLFLIKELNDILEEKNKRDKRLDIDTTEVEFVYDKNGCAIDVIEKGRGVSERIIENFMVLTNNTACLHYSWAPIPYRVHGEPDLDKLKYVLNLIREAGCKFDNSEINEYNIRDIIISALTGLKEIEHSNIWKDLLIRSLPRAIYSTDNIGHFALNCFPYGHTTSPIRRPADLAYHARVDMIDNGTFDYDKFDYYTSIIESICVQANKAERLAQDMERLIESINFASLAEKHIGEECEARITGFNKSSLMMTTTNNVKNLKGILDFDDMDGCKCYYDKEKDCIVDKISKKKFKIGNKFIVLIKSTDSMEGITHFKFNLQQPYQKKLGMMYN